MNILINKNVKELDIPLAVSQLPAPIFPLAFIPTRIWMAILRWKILDWLLRIWNTRKYLQKWGNNKKCILDSSYNFRQENGWCRKFPNLCFALVPSMVDEGKWENGRWRPNQGKSDWHRKWEQILQGICKIFEKVRKNGEGDYEKNEYLL